MKSNGFTRVDQLLNAFGGIAGWTKGAQNLRFSRQHRVIHDILVLDQC
jgi:hypothetical protein